MMPVPVLSPQKPRQAAENSKREGTQSHQHPTAAVHHREPPEAVAGGIKTSKGNARLDEAVVETGLNDPPHRLQTRCPEISQAGTLDRHPHRICPDQATSVAVVAAKVTETAIGLIGVMRQTTIHTNVLEIGHIHHNGTMADDRLDNGILLHCRLLWLLRQSLPDPARNVVLVKGKHDRLVAIAAMAILATDTGIVGRVMNNAIRVGITGPLRNGASQGILKSRPTDGQVMNADEMYQNANRLPAHK